MKLFVNVNPETKGDGLAKAVAEQLGKDSYRHNKSASNIQSPRRVFNGFMLSVRSKWNKSLKAENPNAVSRTEADTIRALVNETEKGDTLAVDKPDLYDFGRKLARSVSYSSMLNEDDIAASIAILAEDYCQNNEYLSFEEIAPKDMLESLKEHAS